MDNDTVSTPPPSGSGYGPPLSPEDYPNIDHLVIEDGKPVDSMLVEKSERLLTEPLYSSWAGPGEGRTFLVLANVGLFFLVRKPPLAPDVMLSLDVPAERDLSRKEHNSYLMWEMGKPPDVVIEFVSDRRGGEETTKQRDYARIGVTYYVIFDPKEWLGHGVLRAFSLRDGEYLPLERAWFEKVGLGLTLWEGTFEGQTGCWLRWCDAKGNLIPTGRERAEHERKLREKERKRADEAEDRIRKLEAQLRASGVEPKE
jgi:hypothetical protein